MRILLLYHFSLDQLPTGRLVRHWAHALQRARHELRVLNLATRPEPVDSLAVDTLACRPDDPAADLPFALPHFSAEPPAAGQPSLTFAQLSDGQLTHYRDQIRQWLDRHIDEFNPHVLHAQHVWVHGQLALESGVPYVLNAWGAELAEYALDPRYRPLAEQAAENASRILVADPAVRERLLDLLPALEDRLVQLTADTASPTGDPAAAASALAAIYRESLEERFGTSE